MKSLFAVPLIILSMGVSMAQTITIPATVLRNFSSRYPEANEVIWSYNETEYEATFRFDNKGISMSFNENGELNVVKNEILRVELPTYVNTLIEREYPGWQFGKALYIDNNVSAYYEAVVEREKESVTLVFDRKGDLMITVLQ